MTRALVRAVPGLPPFRNDPRRKCTTVNPEVFFRIGQRRQRRVAARYCRKCPLVEACAAWAIETQQQHGVWGGMTEEQLRTAGRRPAGVPS